MRLGAEATSSEFCPKRRSGRPQTWTERGKEIAKRGPEYFRKLQASRKNRKGSRLHSNFGNNIVDESGETMQELPCVDIYRYSRAPEEKGCELQFRLVYRCGLPAQGRAGGET